MDLIFEYLIVFILLFVTNISFLVRKYDFNKNKFIPFVLIYGAIVFEHHSQAIEHVANGISVCWCILKFEE